MIQRCNERKIKVEAKRRSRFGGDKRKKTKVEERSNEIRLRRGQKG
jgi:hypothetical protein